MDSFLDKSTGPLNRFFDIVAKLVYINVLFILGTLVGIVFLGVFPALFSAFYVTKRWVNDGNEDLPMFKTFSNYYKKHFWRANRLGLVMALIALISVVDLIYAYEMFIISDDLTIFGVLFSMVSIVFIYVAFSLFIYLPITYVYFERFTTKEMIKFSLVSVFGTPLLTFKLLLIFGLSIVLFSIFISITLFLGVSLPLYIVFYTIKKRYRLFFLIKGNETMSYMNYKYLIDKEKITQFFGKNLDDGEAFNQSLFKQNTLENQQLNQILSTVILSNVDEEVLGFIIVKNVSEIAVEVDWLMVSKHLDKAAVYTEIVEIFLEQVKRLGIKLVYCSLNKKSYHSKLQHLQLQEEVLRQQGFTSEGPQRLKRQL